MSLVRAAFLDPFHPQITSAIERAMPPGWTPAFAGRGGLDPQGAVSDAAVLFVMAAPVTSEIIAAASRLRLVQKLGAGIDRIDLESCRSRGIAVARLNGGNAIPAAEHTLLMILAALRRLPMMERRTRAGEWLKEEARGTSRHLTGKRVGLVGLGAIGKALAKMLSGFNVELWYFDPLVPPAEAERFGARFAPLDELLAACDIVSLHLPLMPGTRNLISRDRIALMKPGAVLVNCARGGLVDEAALIAALREGRLFAAAVDAFAQEPPLGSPLLTLDETVVTPHMAGATLDNFRFIIEHGLRNAIGYLNGDPLPQEDIVFAPEGTFSK
jgi:D-3-phosphoglycerate dehydrogenase